MAINLLAPGIARFMASELFVGVQGGSVTSSPGNSGDIGAFTVPFLSGGDLFGWQIAELPGFEGYPMWQAPNQISGGGLAPRSEDFTQPRSYVEVDSIDDALAKAEANGGRVLMAKAPISDT